MLLIGVHFMKASEIT